MSKRTAMVYILAAIWLAGFVITSTWGTVNRPNTTYNYYGLSSDTKPTTGLIQGSKFYEMDTGRTYTVSMADTTWKINALYDVGDTTTLSGPASTPAVYSRGYDNGGYLFNISNINTSVSLTLQGKAGYSGWCYIDSDSTNYTTDGRKSLLSANIAIYDSVRFIWLAESGGTNTEITYNYSLANKYK